MIKIQNKKAYYDYFIQDKLEVGIELIGCEVKSIRQGKMNLKDSYVSIDNNELFLKQAHISPYENKDSFSDVDAYRKRKLLAHKNEIAKLKKSMEQKGFSIVPLKAYFKQGKVKLEIALATGKKNYDKRQSIKENEAKRKMGEV